MDGVISHRDRAARDATTANALVGVADAGDWEIVVRFYSALHLTQAYLGTKNQRFEAKRHEERWRAIQNSPELTKGGQFPRAYRRLQDMSEQVRYDPGFVARTQDFEYARGDLALVQRVLQSKVDRALAL